MTPFTRISDEICYTTRPVTSIDDATLAELKRLAIGTVRQRIRLCCHPDPQAPIHEMLILHAAGAYVRPHRHHGKPESLLVIEGRADAVLFQDDGNIAERRPLVPPGQDGQWFLRLEGPIFHTLVITSSWFVFLETTAGPFDPAQTEFAPWAPDGQDQTETGAYQADLARRLAAMPDSRYG